MGCKFRLFLLILAAVGGCGAAPGGQTTLDVDSDSDGLSDKDELHIYFTHPANPDTDADGLIDGDEIKVLLTDPLNYDSDGDSASDGQEVALGSNPLNSDTDGDGISDGDELDFYTDILSPNLTGVVTEELCPQFAVVESSAGEWVYGPADQLSFSEGDLVAFSTATLGNPTGAISANLTRHESGSAWFKGMHISLADGPIVSFEAAPFFGIVVHMPQSTSFTVLDPQVIADWQVGDKVITYSFRHSDGTTTAYRLNTRACEEVSNIE